MARKPYTGPTFKERVALNEQQLCVSCKKNYRASISKVCTACQRKLSFYGDAKAGGLPMRRLSRQWIPQAHRLVLLNEQHPGVIAFKAWFEEWIRASIEQPGTKPISKWVANLKPEMALDILKVWVALKLCVEIEKPWQVPTLRSFYFQALRLALLEFFPVKADDKMYWSFIPLPQIREAALYIAQGCAALLQGFVDALLAEEEDAARIKAAQSMPLNRAKDVLPVEKGVNDGHTQ